MQLNRSVIRQKALFIDRDGVIVKMVKYKNPKGFDSPQKTIDVKLVKNIGSIINWVNQHQVLVIEISNQPGVAKGKMDQNTSDAIEIKTHQLLKQSKAKIDHVYICPHHPQGIVPKLTKNCNCRKPQPGLLLKASKDLNIKLSQSIFLGDSASDIEAGKKAGCSTILFFHSNNLPQKVKAAKKSKPNFKVTNHQQTLSVLKKFFL